MDIKFANNASSRLALALAAADTTVRVVATTGELFPQLVGSSDYFMITVTDTEGNMEIMKVTSMFADTFTVVRAQENTEARDFPIDSIVENRLTAGSIEAILNDTTATETTPGRVRIATSSEIIAATATDAVVSAAGVNLITALPGMIVPYSGELYLGVNPINRRTGLPDLTWYLCNGDNGTPNLQDRFILGSSLVHAPNSYGGTTNIVEQLTFDVSEEKTEALKPKFTESTSGTEVPTPHNHDVIAASNAEYLPPYCALVYLMKIS